MRKRNFSILLVIIMISSLFPMAAFADDDIQESVSLPIGYKQLDFIQSTGTQYINTGVKASSSIRAEMDFVPVEYSGDIYLGTIKGNDNNDWRYFVTGGGTSYFDCGSTRTNKSVGITLGKRYVVYVGTKDDMVYQMIIDYNSGNDILDLSADAAGTVNEGDICIFGGFNGNNLRFAKIKLYSLKIYDGDTLIRDFVPCLDADRTAGLYDTVGEDFYYNDKADGSEFIIPHDMEKVSGVDASEGQDGYRDAWYCSECELYFEDEMGTMPIGNEEAYEAWKTDTGKSIAVVVTSSNIGDNTTWANGNVYIISEDVSTDNRINVSGKVTLILNDNCKLTANRGIGVPQNSCLTIESQSNGGNMGSIEATLNPSNDYIAAIGGNNNSCGTIIINGGNITTVGGYEAAGIGCGSGGNGKVIINGGRINSTGGFHGAGVGGGYASSCDIEINNGMITSTGGEWGAGMGTGYKGNSKVIINEGSVTAKGADWAAGIGGGNQSGADIIINGGSVNATGGSCASGIGCGNCLTDRTVNITICGGYIYAIGGEYASGIGSAYFNENVLVDIRIYNASRITSTKGNRANDSIGIGYGDDTRLYRYVSDLMTIGSGGYTNSDIKLYQNTEDAVAEQIDASCCDAGHRAFYLHLGKLYSSQETYTDETEITNLYKWISEGDGYIAPTGIHKDDNKDGKCDTCSNYFYTAIMEHGTDEDVLSVKVVIKSGETSYILAGFYSEDEKLINVQIFNGSGNIIQHDFTLPEGYDSYKLFLLDSTYRPLA